MGCGAQHTGCGGFEIGFESAVDCTDYADGQTANRIAVRKCRCWTAKPFPVQQPPLFDGKSSCCPATAAAVRPNGFLRSNRRCQTVNPVAVQETPLRYGQTVSCAATAAAGQ